MRPYEFTCPDCRQAFVATEPMREATVRSGCPICGAAVAREHFTATAMSD